MNIAKRCAQVLLAEVNRSAATFVAFAAFAIVANSGDSAHAQAESNRDSLVVASWNLEWFYDEQQGDNYGKLGKEQSAPSRESWEWKRDTVAGAIAKMKPDILALQEVENQQVLYYLVKRLKANHGLGYRIAFVQGHDYFTEQDVGILYRPDLIEVGRWESTRSEFNDETYYSVNKHQFAKFYIGKGPQREILTVVNLHFRARAEQAQRRQRQARQLNLWLKRLPADQRKNLIVLGDFNTEHRWGEPHEVKPSELDVLRTQETDATTDDLTDLHQHLSPSGRTTHLGGGQFDRLLVSQGLMQDGSGTDLVFNKVRVAKELCVRGQPDKSHWEASPYWKIPKAERDISDHYPVVATFLLR